MENTNEKKNYTALKVIGVILVVAAACFIGYKIYQKIKANKEKALKEAEELALLRDAEELECESYDAPAHDVLANAEEISE